MQFAGHWMGIYMRQLRIFGFHSVSGRIHTFWDTIKWVRTHPLTELNCNIKRNLKLLLQVIIIYDLRYITIEFWRHTGYTLQANFTAEAFPTKLKLYPFMLNGRQPKLHHCKYTQLWQHPKKGYGTGHCCQLCWPKLPILCMFYTYIQMFSTNHQQLFWYSFKIKSDHSYADVNAESSLKFSNLDQ